MAIPFGYRLIDFWLRYLRAFPLKLEHKRSFRQFLQLKHDRKLSNGLKVHELSFFPWSTNTNQSLTISQDTS
jgi:hypothetical protein